jgi:putative membrane protein
MAKLLATIVVALAVPAAAYAADPATDMPHSSSTAAPLEGANSFTEAQARKRIADAGFTDIGALTKDDHGVWRTSAAKDGAPVSVSLDFKGNVVASAGKVTQ